MPHWHISVRESGVDSRTSGGRDNYAVAGTLSPYNGFVYQVHPRSTPKQDSDLQALIFGLEHDGVSLELFAYLFEKEELKQDLK